jgi:hypothetical protein
MLPQFRLNFNGNTSPTKTGWQPIRATDLQAAGTGPGTCDRCGRRDLRFLHTVHNLDEGELQVGSECARRLCYGYSPEREEQRLRNLWARRSRWLTRNWGTSWKGNETLTFKHEGKTVRVTVFPGNFGGWSYCIAFRGDPLYPSGSFLTADAAKLDAFDRVAVVAGW